MSQMSVRFAPYLDVPDFANRCYTVSDESGTHLGFVCSFTMRGYTNKLGTRWGYSLDGKEYRGRFSSRTAAGCWLYGERHPNPASADELILNPGASVEATNA